MLILHHMLCVFLTLTLSCVTVTSATNQHTLSVPINISNIHSYSLIQTKLLEDSDDVQRQRQEQLEQQKQKADEAIKQIEKIVNDTNESITEAEAALEKARQENIEAIAISEELNKINGVTEEEKAALRTAYTTTYSTLESAKGSFRIAKEVKLPDLLRALETARNQKTAITGEGDKFYDNDRHVSIIQSELRDANTTAKQIKKKLQEVMEKVQKVNEAYNEAQSVKAQVESRVKTNPVSPQPSVNTTQNSNERSETAETASPSMEVNKDTEREGSQQTQTGDNTPAENKEKLKETEVKREEPNDNNNNMTISTNNVLHMDDACISSWLHLLLITLGVLSYVMMG